ncbi:hypothetical protein Acr_15g0007020 [Actinidia rufa]|uniref:CCHC-type domain-containing protein n=1 Tax=Actinidia rufa TaxID=165716 RepID=A0A7J0FTS7_9ERIC|nr:hypothetical protein Acr_15g0007020 [Actinidia rufa]
MPRPSSHQGFHGGLNVAFINIRYNILQQQHIPISPNTFLALFVSVTLNFLELKYQGKDFSPFQTHPKMMRVATVSLLLYCFAYDFEKRLCSPAYVHIVRSGRAVFGLLLSVSLASVLFQDSVCVEARRREMGSTDQSESQALVSEGSRERGRGQGRGHHRGTGKGRWRSQTRGRTVRCFYCDQEGHIKRDCPKYKAQDQSSDTAATAVMADEDESEVLLAASDDGKSDWVLDSASRVVGRGSVQFRMADGRSVTLTEVRHVPNIRKNLISIGMLDAKGCSFEASGGILRVSKGNKEMLWGKKTRGLYRLEGNVLTGGATVRHRSSGISEKNGQGKQPLHRGTQSKRRGTWGIRNGTWRIRSGTRAQGDALGYVRKSGQTRVMQPVQDVHREAQRKETKSILRSCTAKGAVTPKRVSFALDLISGGVLSSLGGAGHLGEKVQGTSVWRCIHFGGKWSSPLMRLVISDVVLQSYGGAGSEVVRKDNLKTSDYPPVGWRGRLLSPAHLDESKPTWMSPSPIAKPKPDWSSYGVSM